MDVLDVTATVIGYATSTNGITWTVTSSEALSGDSSALWDSVGIPCVIKDGDTYKMWYTQGISYLTPEDLEGTYRVELEIVDVNGLSGAFEVKGVPPAAPPPAQTNGWLYFMKWFKTLLCYQFLPAKKGLTEGIRVFSYRPFFIYPGEY